MNRLLSQLVAVSSILGMIWVVWFIRLNTVALVCYLIDTFENGWDQMLFIISPPSLMETIAPPPKWYEQSYYVIVSNFVLSKIDLVLSVFLGLLTLAIVIRTKRLRTTIQRMRGVRFEACVEGSDFFSSGIPSFQVSIVSIGTFLSKHIGYAVRVKNFLVLPAHVLLRVRETGGQLGISTRKGVTMLSATPFESKLMNDVVYIPCSSEFFSDNGIAAGKPLAMRSNGVMVSCAGKRGATTGLLSKSFQRGILVYRASTEAGMSGAAYVTSVSGHSFYGIHTGVRAEDNIGISAAPLMAEMDYLSKTLAIPEARKSRDKRDYVAPTGEKAENLTKSFLPHARRSEFFTDWSALVEDAYSKDYDNSWALGEDIDYNAKLDFGDDFECEAEKGENLELSKFASMMKQQSAANLEAMSAIIQNIKSYKSVEALGQADDNEGPVGVTAGPVVAPTFADLLQSGVAAQILSLDKQIGEITGWRKTVEDRLSSSYALILENEKSLSNHEERIRKLEGKPETDNAAHVCNLHKQGGKLCLKVFISERALEQHQTSAKHVLGESALAEDFKTPVKTNGTRFLGKRRPAPSNKLKEHSKVSTESAPSQALMEILSKMIDSQTRFEKSLEKLAQAMSGPTSA